MDISEAARTLRHMYVTAPAKEKALSIHLFAIRYADQIRHMSPRELVILAELPESYSTEIRKGINLAKYVEPRK